MPAKIEISHRTIIFTVLFLTLLWFLAQIREIIFVLLVAFIIMSALNPSVDYLEKKNIPRQLGLLLIYIILLIFIAFAGSSIIPPLITQTIHLGQNFPDYLKSVLPFVNIDTQTIITQLTPIGQNILLLTIGLFSNLVAIFSLFVISFYLIMEHKNLEIHLASFTGTETAKTLVTVILKIEERLGAWVRGQIILGFTIGLSTFIGLILFGLPYTLPLALLAGILEIIPTIGPILSAVPAILIALTISPLMALAIVFLYFAIQQLEAHLIVPMVMKKAVGMPPLVTIIALLIGAKLAGIGGALLSVPVVLIVETITGEYFKLKEAS